MNTTSLISTNTKVRSSGEVIPAEDAPRLWKRIAFVGLLLISLSDIYFPSLGIPIVPMTGMTLFVAVTILWPRHESIEGRIKRRNTVLLSLGLISLYTVSVMWGLAAFGSGGIKAAMGMSLGTLILTFMLNQEDNPFYRKAILQACTQVMVFHLCFWLVQFAVFIFSHTFIDFLLPITGVPTRHTIGAAGIEVRLDRCSGLFAEPSIYVTNMYFLVTIRVIRQKLKLKFLDILVLASMVGSIAITGILLAVIVIIVCTIPAIRTVKSALSILAVLGAFVGLLATLGGTDLMLVLTARLDAPTSDPSGKVRTVDAFNTFEKLSESAQIFGIGVGNVEVVDHISNGFLDILISFGVVGLTIFLYQFIFLMRMRKAPFLFWLFLLGMMGGGPYTTILFWWVWFASMSFGNMERDLDSKRTTSSQNLLLNSVQVQALD